ncbi:DnaD domain protein [Liquorilactobacillus satsumensis]|uniref:DnaD domain-containing protein n=1 Tax=Liquorilactobacillus satsumensis TaxID=259059 RepID=UPI0021C4AD04|nr:DnaD domain protein [Liquorilactobacillus satsumensis]MCP9312318.1 DnaD domain protein [Liquorilactobacillus satsumensis]MCP9327707.1 DnaD domain protein [Liquorilactobacillus satsumensis]MCP9359678.1 DnaD domain protein [Liquorilactobacillus satsumensis]
MDKTLKKYLVAGQTTVSNLILHNYSALGLNEEELVLLLELLSEQQRGNAFPAGEKIARAMGKKPQAIYQLLHSLIAKKVMQIVSIPAADGKTQDVYRFELLYEKIGNLEQKEEQKLEQADQAVAQAKVYSSIEVEFGRPLSPIEIETVDSWLHQDHYRSEVILLALREAVLNQAYSLKYIDRILLSWERQNIKTAQDVERAKQKMRTNGKNSTSEEQTTTSNDKPLIPLYRWSDQSDDKQGE